MKKLEQWLFWQLIILLILIVLGIVFQGQISGLLSKENAKHYIQTSAQQMMDNKKTSASYDYSKIRSMNIVDVLNAQLSNQEYPAIGIMSVPDLGIVLPVFQGVSDDNMLYGAATLKDNQTMGQGNYALASHHITGFYGYDASQLLFTPLEKAQKGQKIYLTDKRKVYEYEIISTLVTDILKLSMLQNHGGEKEITLITCQSYESPNRIVVQGKLIGEAKFDKETAPLFNQQFEGG
jgi:sortase A